MKTWSVGFGFLFLLASAIEAAQDRPVKPVAPGFTPVADGRTPVEDPGWLAHVQEQIAQEEYDFSAVGDGSWSAPNRAQELRTRVGPSVVEIFPRATDWSGKDTPWKLGLSLRGLRLGERNLPIASGEVAAQGNAALLRVGVVMQWIENTEDGIGQRIEVARSPGAWAGAELVLELEILGGLRLELDEERTGASFVEPGGDTVLRLDGLMASGGGGELLDVFLRSDGDVLALHVAGQPEIYPVTISATYTGGHGASQMPPSLWTWSKAGGQSGAFFGTGVSTAGDVDGDGFSDVMVGAPGFDAGLTDQGRAFLFRGISGGLEPLPAWTFDGEQADGGFGFHVQTAGDVNGDGYDDVLVGAIHYSVTPMSHEGKVYLFPGSQAGLAAAPSWTVEGEQQAVRCSPQSCFCGDVNADGFDDVLVAEPSHSATYNKEGRVRLYLGGPQGLAVHPHQSFLGGQDVAHLGGVAGAGDVNGDGFQDALLCASGWDGGQSNEGLVSLHLGTLFGLSKNPVWSFQPDQDDALLARVSTAGDINGDGFADVMLAAVEFDGAFQNSGRVWVFHGNATGLETQAEWTQDGSSQAAQLGQSLQPAGDYNGDGFGDVVFTDEKIARVHLGSSSGLEGTPVWISPTVSRICSTAGDVNGDGFADILVAHPEYDGSKPDQGKVGLRLGRASRKVASETWKTPPVIGYHDRSFVDWAGDVNGDGLSEVLVGQREFDGGQVDEGSCHLFLGTRDGLSMSTAWSYESNQASAGFGDSIAGAGDVNGDGYDDFIVGAPFFDGGEVDEGKVFLFMGNALGSPTASSWPGELDHPDAMFGDDVDGAGDVNADGFADFLVGGQLYTNGEQWEGACVLFLGSPTGPSSAPDWIVEGNQVEAACGGVAGAGDVNGDGFSDVAIGVAGFDGSSVDCGKVEVYLGSASGLSSTPVWTKVGDAPGFLGSGQACAGDDNRDGKSDHLIGAPLYEYNQGRAYLYRGHASGLEDKPNWIGSGKQDGAFFGQTLAGIGDINGDGKSDFAVGSPRCDGAYVDSGQVQVWLGGAGGVSFSGTIEGESGPGEWLGISVAGAGDCNGDGFCDLLYGSQSAGATLHYGNTRGLSRFAWQVQAGPDPQPPIALLGSSVTPDSFRIDTFGRTPAGRGILGVEYEVQPYGGPFTGQNILTGSNTGLTSAPGLGGSFLSSSELVGGLPSATPIAWRLRFTSPNPYFKRSPWRSMPGNGSIEVKLRTAP